MANILKNFINNNKLKVTSVYYDINTSLLEAIFPIGRGFIDFTNTDYSNYLGFTWERELVGMVGVGLDVNQSEFNTIGKTGGEKTHILTVAEMPEHSHSNLTIDVTKLAWANQFSTGNNQGGLGTSGNVDDHNIYTDMKGGSQPHNNLQPYKVVAYWKRVA